MTDMPAIAIAGIAGRMGKELARLAADGGYPVTGGTEAPGSPHIGEDLGRLAGSPALQGVAPVTDAVAAATGARVWVDFTTPAATLGALDALRHTSVTGVIIGTTGFSAGDLSAIERASQSFAIVKAGNFSLGVAMLAALVKMAAERLGPDWDVDVLETHHRRKVDAPSGTALMLGEALAQGRGAPLDTLRAPPYEGAEATRNPGEIGFAVRRAGGIVGEHEVLFASEQETLRLAHTALDRAVFAEGALTAARWAAGQPPGLYTIQDVLGL